VKNNILDEDEEKMLGIVEEISFWKSYIDKNECNGTLSVLETAHAALEQAKSKIYSFVLSDTKH